MLPLTRAVAWFIVPFLIVGFAVLWPVPTDTSAVFAWTIAPPLTAMILGAAYLGGAYFFVRVGLASSWQTIKGGFVPVVVFATLLGIATIVHWDKFNHRHVAFWLWTGLYFTTPFLIALVYWRNRGHDRPNDESPRLPLPVVAILGCGGILATAVGLVLFLAPAMAIGLWPWHLTPLTAKVMGAVLCLGLAGVGVFADRRWASARIPLQVALVMLVFMVVAGLRAGAQFAAGAVVTIVLAALYFRMERVGRA